MEVVLSPSQMREYDRYAIEVLGIPGAVLMENAGGNTVREISHHFGPLNGKSIAIIAGKGNNGGDGFVIARHLLNEGCKVSVLLLGKARELKGDALLNYKVLEQYRKKAIGGELSIAELSTTRSLNKLSKPDFIIDAIFGTGFTGTITGFTKKVIEWINQSGVPTIAVDIPSGLNGLTGERCGASVKAQMTVTMAFRKTGLTVGDAMSYCGRVKVVSIGGPPELPAQSQPDTYRIQPDDVSVVLPQRSTRAHKYSFGKVLIVAGARGMTGAAAMSSSAVLRIGGGMVALYTPLSSYQVLAQKLTEVMVTPVAETAQGTLAMAAFDEITAKLEWADHLILGPGIGKNRETQDLVRDLLREFKGQVVLDADGLNAVDAKFLANLHRGTTLTLTPHTAELSRLTGISSTIIEQSRIESARSAAGKMNAIVILKGAPTVTATPEGTVFINTTGNPSLATPGSGDILTGMVAGLQAQHISPIPAAYSAVFLHGMAADALAEQYGDRGLLATDLLGSLPRVTAQLRTTHGN